MPPLRSRECYGRLDGQHTASEESKDDRDKKDSRNRNWSRSTRRGQPKGVLDLLTEGRTATRRLSFFDPTPFRSQVAAECSFDISRDSFVIGEGAAVLVLEELERVRARGAHVYCEVSGYAARSNAFHITGLKPGGAEMAAAISDALRQARANPSDIDHHVDKVLSVGSGFGGFQSAVVLARDGGDR